MSGRLKRLAYRPFDRQRYKGSVVPAYIVEAELDAAMRRPASEKKAVSYGPVQAQLVDVNNGFLSPLAPRYQTFVDYYDEWIYDHDLIQAGQITVFRKTVPDGQAWYIDNFYFYAYVLGGVWGTFMADSAALSPFILMRVFTSSTQLAYSGEEQGKIAAGLPVTTVPFLNDRLGAREAKFGLTMYEGESISATLIARNALVPVPPVTRIGFRMMGLQMAKNDAEDYLEAKKWHQD